MRRALDALACALAAMACPVAAGADEPGVSLAVTCRHEAAPGRVLCEAELETVRGRIAWADVVVRSAPTFAKPLRSRIAPKQASARTPVRVRFPIALVATEKGEGRLVLEGRAVRCRRRGGDELGETCITETSPARHGSRRGGTNPPGTTLMPPRRMRMAELARLSGVSRETIHYYLREGLLPKPVKGGRTVAYYDESHLERLRLIRSLRGEKYLPLAVIRRMISMGPKTHGRDVETLADVLSIDPTLARETPEVGPDDETMRVALELGLLGDQVKNVSAADPTHARVLSAVAEAVALDGDARQLTLDDLRACARELSKLVETEAALFFDLVIRRGDMARSVESLRAGRGAVARFITAYRDLMLRRVVDDILEAISSGTPNPATRAILPLGDDQLGRLGVAKKRALLIERAEAGDAAAANDLVWHLFVVAPSRELAALGGSVRELLRPRARVLLCAASPEPDEAELERLVERAAPFALGEVLLGEAKLLRLLSVGPKSGSFIDEVVPVLHRLANLHPEQEADPLASACAFYRRGLVGLSLPRVLGRHGLAIDDLERCIEVLVAAPGRIDASARARIEGNARLMVGRWHAASGGLASAARELERARSIDPSGPIGAAAEAAAAEAPREPLDA